MLVPKTLYFVFGVHPCFAIVGPRKKKNHWSGRGCVFFALRGLSRFLSLSLLRSNKKKGSESQQKRQRKKEKKQISVNDFFISPGEQ